MPSMSFTADNELPNDIDQLKQLVLSQQELLSSQLEAHSKALRLRDKQLAKRDELIADLEERLALLLAKRFGRSSEKLTDNQMRLFDETELEQAIAALAKELQAEVETEEKKKSKRKAAKPKRDPLPDKLRRIDIIVDVDDEEKSRMEV